MPNLILMLESGEEKQTWISFPETRVASTYQGTQGSTTFV